MNDPNRARQFSPNYSRRVSRDPATMVLARMVPDEPDLEAQLAAQADELQMLHEANQYLRAALQGARAALRETRAPEQCVVYACLLPRHEASTTLGLCEHHLNEAVVDYAAMMKPTWDERKRHEAHQYPEVVYYIRMGDRVKIGRTTNVAKRMATFYAQPEQLLAVEPCVIHNGILRETQRHREFAEWRVNGTELFDLSPELSAHIDHIVETFGDPKHLLG